MTDKPVQDDQLTTKQENKRKPASAVAHDPKEVGGPKGPEPTRFGDWEQKGRCTDF